MKFLKDVVKDAVQKHPFQRISDLTPDEFTELMTDVLENAMQSQEFQNRLSDEIVTAFRQLM